MKCIEANQLKIRNQSSRIYNFSNKEKEKKINEINLEERYDLDGNVYSIKFRDDVTDKFYIDDYFDSDQIFWTLSRKLINSDWQLTHVIPHPWNTSSDRVYYFSRP